MQNVFLSVFSFVLGSFLGEVEKAGRRIILIEKFYFQERKNDENDRIYERSGVYGDDVFLRGDGSGYCAAAFAGAGAGRRAVGGRGFEAEAVG